MSEKTKYVGPPSRLINVSISLGSKLWCSPLRYTFLLKFSNEDRTETIFSVVTGDTAIAGVLSVSCIPTMD